MNISNWFIQRSSIMKEIILIFKFMRPTKYPFVTVFEKRGKFMTVFGSTLYIDDEY